MGWGASVELDGGDRAADLSTEGRRVAVRSELRARAVMAAAVVVDGGTGAPVGLLLASRRSDTQEETQGEELGRRGGRNWPRQLVPAGGRRGGDRRVVCAAWQSGEGTARGVEGGGELLCDAWKPARARGGSGVAQRGGRAALRCAGGAETKKQRGKPEVEEKWTYL